MATISTTMALRVRAGAVRLFPSVPSRSYSCSILIAQENLAIQTPPILLAHNSFPSQYQYKCFFPGRKRSFSSSSNSNKNNVSLEEDSSVSSSDKSVHSQEIQPLLVYEGPFASLTLKLKRVSLTSAVIGIVGLPALSLFYGAGSVPATGQLAVIATAGVTAVGSTALLGYCFSPYVHTLEQLSGNFSESDGGNDADDAANLNQNLVRIVTRDILARRVETIFDPTTDVTPPPNNNSRPFCNFMVKGLPMYVHPELVHDHKLRVQLVGEEPQQKDADMRNKTKTDDDEFL
eukprot:CAMPEP_0183717694 /NCGR_PEP_ID=MMETSP0737-20130205/11231_1 /TAXON_ID=385413 /ORGANISM="Thalassiosira miniscula, Strain CCMP1093" /LENGTH=289 /DNA_ID=CAMNT_0025947171 /DNA_START=152 /DNA_END=1021 /DNA_ORIENTATION=-